MRRPWNDFLLGCSVAFAAVACAKKTETLTTVTARSTWPVPAKDMTARCADVADLRICWGEEAHGTDCRDGICMRPAPMPDVPSPDGLGWRCAGLLTERTCEPRSRKVPLFQCEGARCAQHYPRMPDDGEWACIDSAGAAVCLGGQAPAGVATGRADPSWQCAPRRARTLPTGSQKGEMVCVDLSPDFPNGVPRGWKCRYEREPLRVRICERAPEAHVLSDACSEAKPCVDGSHCVAGRCVPPEPRPSCWLDADCETGACRFGTCREPE